MIWYNFIEEKQSIAITAFSTSKTDLPLNIQRAFNEQEVPELKIAIWKNIKSNLSSQLGIPPEKLVFAKQTHSANIHIVEGNTNLLIPDTDGLITNKHGLCLCIQTADCTPILLADPVQKVVAALHAGWRGTAQNIVGNALTLMQQHYGSESSNIMAYIGPCISQEIYEVGSDVFDAFNAIGLASENIFIKGKIPGKYYCNLNRANTELLLRHGLLTDNIKTDNHCTFMKHEDYYSARRDGGKTGRIITGIMIN